MHLPCRYMWRGRLDVQAKDFQFAMALGPQPSIDETTERMLVSLIAVSLFVSCFKACVEFGICTGQLLRH